MDIGIGFSQASFSTPETPAHDLIKDDKSAMFK